MRKIVINIHLDKDLYDWVCEEAKIRHCSISQVIRDLIVKEKTKKE